MSNTQEKSADVHSIKLNLHPIKKLSKLWLIVFLVESFEFVSEEKKYDEASGYNQCSLLYKVKCSRTTLKETFIVVSDEGKLGIIFYNVENLEE